MHLVLCGSACIWSCVVVHASGPVLHSRQRLYSRLGMRSSALRLGASPWQQVHHGITMASPWQQVHHGSKCTMAASATGRITMAASASVPVLCRRDACAPWLGSIGSRPCQRKAQQVFKVGKEEQGEQPLPSGQLKSGK